MWTTASKVILLLLVKNEISISENDVNIVNEKGNKVYYIKAPGNYSLHFKRIQVDDNVGHLTGEIGVTLQVPILEGPAGKDAVPSSLLAIYTMF